MYYLCFGAYVSALACLQQYLAATPTFCHTKPCISRMAGLFMLPLLPLMMENCAECTYPVSEDISMGLMFAGTHTCSWRWCGLLCVTT
jgi:hypothetical protein